MWGGGGRKKTGSLRNRDGGCSLVLEINFRYNEILFKDHPKNSADAAESLKEGTGLGQGFTFTWKCEGKVSVSEEEK